MKGSQKIILAIASIAALVSGAGTAKADPWHDNGNHWDNRGRNDTYIYRNYDHQDNGRYNYNYQRNVGRPTVIKIYDNDRVILTQYVQDRYYKSYPRSWYQHHHGYPSYRPVERRYIVGYPLPQGVVYYSVPYEIRSRLRPTPIGYEYIRVDNDVLLMNQASKMIVDAVTLLASANR